MRRRPRQRAEAAMRRLARPLDALAGRDRLPGGVPDLRGELVLVTGASSGIGAALAAALAREGAALALAARREERLQQVAEQCRRAGAAAVLPVVCDLGTRAGVERFVAEAERFGAPRVLVNNAGSGWNGRFEQMPPEAIDRLVATNLTGLLHTTRACLPGMVERRAGLVVQVASLAGLVALPYSAVYTATKHAVAALSHTLAAELRETGVGVTAFHPGAFATEFHDHAPLGAAGALPPSTGAEQIVGLIRRPRRDLVDDRMSLWRLTTEALLGGRRDRALAAAMEGAEDSLLPR